LENGHLEDREGDRMTLDGYYANRL